MVRHVATLGHYFLIPNPLVFALIPVSVAYLADKQILDYYSLWFDPTGASLIIYLIFGEHANLSTTDAVVFIMSV